MVGILLPWVVTSVLLVLVTECTSAASYFFGKSRAFRQRIVSEQKCI